MILALSIRFRKFVAAFLWLVFYVQLIAPLRSLGETVVPLRRTYPVTPAYLSRGWFPYGGPKVTVEVKREPEKVVKAAPQKKARAIRPAEGGPATPEASSFQKVGVDKLVDLFTGDFSYSIPLMDVDGYPVNLFYNGGITMEQDASWVGLG